MWKNVHNALGSLSKDGKLEEATGIAFPQPEKWIWFGLLVISPIKESYTSDILRKIIS